MSNDRVVIVSAKRTPIGSFQGNFESLKATELASRVIEKNINDISINPKEIDETIMGCVLSAGLGQAPARQAAMGAGIPSESGATTINKMCGSGMKSIMFGHDSIKAQQNNIVVAGGLENMTNAPYILSKARKGFRMGHADVKDHMFLDGLEDAYEEGKLMGSFAEDTSEHYQFTREQQDNFAITSLERAKKANEDGTFDSEIVPIKVLNRKNEIIINKDEQPFKSDITKIPTLRPAFRKNGTVTAANSSSISDGASSVILMLESEAQKRGIKPLARIIDHSTNSQEPKWFTTAPIGAIEKVLEKSG
ncbi:MAG: acetyl-CoA C-acyltransferase, partial [Alphaproteobacteria bacterium TMED194]